MGHVGTHLGVIQREGAACAEGNLKCMRKTSCLSSAGPQDAVRIGGRKDFVGISVIG